MTFRIVVLNRFAAVYAAGGGPFGPVCFRDILHGRVVIPDVELSRLLRAAFECPEVMRLRYLRMLNQDASYMQDLSTAQRLAHSVGVAYSALLVGSQSRLDRQRVRNLVMAGLLHDAGITPYGHLIEWTIRAADPTFSHERVLRGMLCTEGSERSAINAVLASFGISGAEVADLIDPPPGLTSAISADIDLDNIDNVHRMAALLGYPGVKENHNAILQSARIDGDSRLRFFPHALPLIRRWLELRRIVYEQMIAHPSCVAYNAFLRDVAISAVNSGIVGSRKWVLTEPQLEERLLANRGTRRLATQLRSGCKYRLLDYVLIDLSAARSHASAADEVVKGTTNLAFAGAKIYHWVERNKIARPVRVRLTSGQETVLGHESLVILVALVSPDGAIDKSFVRERWRKEVLAAVLAIVEEVHFSFPENFQADFDMTESPLQIRMF